MSKYILFRRDYIDDGKIANVYLVNILQTALAIQENYAAFRTVVGFDFDPIKIVYEIQDLDSEFWNKTLKHAGLLGILLGFGAQNSWIFQWKYSDQAFCLRDVQQEFSESQKKGNASLANFRIPVFAIF